MVQPVLIPGGGTEAVTAWTIEALKNHYHVSLISFSEADPQELNRYYGTNLEEGEFSSLRPKISPLLNRTKRFLLLKDHLMARYCKSTGNRFDLFISVGGTMDFGSPGIQYMSLAPGAILIKVLEGDPSLPGWYQLAKRSFMRLCEMISATSQERIIQNTTLVNSRWVGNLVERIYGIQDWQVVYPPVNTSQSPADWGSRNNGFLCVARVSPEKKIEDAIQIIQRVREEGFEVSLKVIGRQDDPEYAQRLRRLCEESGAWVTMEGPFPRTQLLELMGSHRYGINAAEDEPFGIALAEMVTSGCIVFVPNSGGQTEVVNESRLTYSGLDDAVAKITGILSDEHTQLSLLDQLGNREEVFSTQAFCNGVKSVVDGFFPICSVPPGRFS